MILIAWQHEVILFIAEIPIRGGDPKGVPQHWPGHTRFDLVWVFDLKDSGKWSSPRFPTPSASGGFSPIQFP